MTISIVIPTINEASNIALLLPYLKQYGGNLVKEIIVVDGGSSDNTVALSLKEKVIVLTSPIKGRAAQMNLGAKYAQGDILYFVHADSLPPKSFAADIIEAVMCGFLSGCFRFQFNSKNFLLKINAYCTRFNSIMCRGGDQTLFVTTRLFWELGGYDKSYIIMEDFEFIQRLQQASKFRIIPRNVVVSARKYEKNSYLKVNLVNLLVFILYFTGSPPQKMRNIYKRMVDHY